MALSLIQSESLNLADNYAFTGNVTGTGGSNILETFTVVCNGEAITVPSGTYTPANVTAAVAVTDTHTVINGSSIAYTPPTGATSVIYEFKYKVAWVTSGGIFHTAMRIDGTQITGSRKTSGYYGTYDQAANYFKWRIPIGGSASTATGRVASWTSSKTIDMTIRRYNATYQGNLFYAYYWDGGATNLPIEPPILSITALK